MDLQLFSLDHAPKALPLWEHIRNDLGNPTAKRIGRTLDVGASTIYRWNQTGKAPRMACLALFWLTRWGRSQIHAQAVNDAILTAELARSLAEELAEERRPPDGLEWPVLPRQEPLGPALLELRQARRWLAPPAATPDRGAASEKEQDELTGWPPGSGAAANALPRPSAGEPPSCKDVDAAPRARQRPGSDATAEPAASRRTTRTSPSQTDEAPAAYGQLPGATAPDPACSAFAALANTLQRPTGNGHRGRA